MFANVVMESLNDDAHGSSVLPSSSHWQALRQLENRILLQKMLNIDTKPSQVDGFLRGIWCVGVSWRTGELTGDVGFEWKVSPFLRASNRVVIPEAFSSPSKFVIIFSLENWRKPFKFQLSFRVFKRQILDFANFKVDNFLPSQMKRTLLHSKCQIWSISKIPYQKRNMSSWRMLWTVAPQGLGVGTLDVPQGKGHDEFLGGNPVWTFWIYCACAEIFRKSWSRKGWVKKHQWPWKESVRLFFSAWAKPLTTDHRTFVAET